MRLYLSLEAAAKGERLGVAEDSPHMGEAIGTMSSSVSCVSSAPGNSAGTLTQDRVHRTEHRSLLSDPFSCLALLLLFSLLPASFILGIEKSITISRSIFLPNIVLAKISGFKIQKARIFLSFAVV